MTKNEAFDHAKETARLLKALYPNLPPHQQKQAHYVINDINHLTAEHDGLTDDHIYVLSKIPYPPSTITRTDLTLAVKNKLLSKDLTRILDHLEAKQHISKIIRRATTYQRIDLDEDDPLSVIQSVTCQRTGNRTPFPYSSKEERDIHLILSNIPSPPATISRTKLTLAVKNHIKAYALNAYLSTLIAQGKVQIYDSPTSRATYYQKGA